MLVTDRRLGLARPVGQRRPTSASSSPALGWLVVHRAARSDVTWAFLAAYAALALRPRLRGSGDPLAIPLHQLESGAFLIFAFFMISDPKTTPDSRAGRIALRRGWSPRWRSSSTSASTGRTA